MKREASSITDQLHYDSTTIIQVMITQESLSTTQQLLISMSRLPMLDELEKLGLLQISAASHFGRL